MNATAHTRGTIRTRVQEFANGRQWNTQQIALAAAGLYPLIMASGDRRDGPDLGPVGFGDRRMFLRALYGATVGLVVAACSGNDADVFAEGTAGNPAVSTDDGSTAAAGGQERSSEQTLRVQTDTGSVTSVDPSTSEGQMVSSSTSSTSAPTSTQAIDGSTTTSTVPTSSSSTTTSTPTTPSTSTTTGSGGALPAGGTMVIAFTYEQASGGKNVPPYIAVWIEDGAGNLLTTVSLWYQQFGRGERWLPDLTRWYNVDQSRISGGGPDTVDAISGPTRSPGSYQVAWDGMGTGGTAPAGNYFICIESARERGPYSLIRESMNLDGSSRQQNLSADGELTNASVTVTA